MRIVTKFNLVLIGVSAVAMGCTGYLSYSILQENAKREVIHHAGMLLETALAIRGYTVSEIDPLLVDQMKTHFLPQSVPAYAATQSFDKVRQDHPDYSYKEATLNPINLAGAGDVSRPERRGLGKRYHSCLPRPPTA